MSHYKIIFGGPVGAGKTTAVAAASDIPPVRTDAAASDEVRSIKPLTTVAMDYGLMKLADGSTIHLYGTPGQDRFDFMWEILTMGGIALILLVDNSRADPVKDMRFYLQAFKDFISRTAVAIGVTHTDAAPLPELSAYAQALEEEGMSCAPIFTVDARNKRDICLLIEAVLSVIDPLARA
ncbi:ATP/GTP-binding protein [Zoogloea sp.]|jgi:signal recognition particle receptor subunit beta|uniref:GTP-binding protein n=1 Tax=Zoogloea sp. TaxID=49181 RepID=UPI0035B37E06|nr:ATP/GTP-binding protein [Rhodocyclales bacterium]